ncbi:MAG TPA: hypothetical protein DIW31_02970 [Bacteroidales bacterium]|nr:hypothetical protein [Bacteroidales bacterium]
MKKLTFLAIFLLSTYLSISQDQLTLAFSDSYAKEKSGKYADAVTSLKAYYDEKSYEINLRLGWLTYLQGQFSESLGYYNKAVELMPYAIEPRLGVALPASALGNWDMVIAQYNKILSIDPNNTLTLYRMGLISYEKKEYQQAYKYFEKIVNLYPFDHDSLLMFAWANLKLGKTREAKILFNKTLLYNPDDASAKEGLALIK